MLETFALVLKRRPVSLGSRGRGQYQQAVREQARSAAPPQPFTCARMYARVVWFHRISKPGDVDNILKPILDALEEVVYDEDSQIGECLAVRVDAAARYEISENWAHETAYGELIATLAENPKHVVYVEVGSASDQKVGFGRIEAQQR